MNENPYSPPDSEAAPADILVGRDNAFLMNLRRLGFVEGVSTLVLFGIAMPLKYMAGIPAAVRIAGSVHGFLFVLLSVMLMLAVTKVPISKRLAMAGMIAAVVPFGPFVFDRWLEPQSKPLKPSKGAQ